MVVAVLMVLAGIGSLLPDDPATSPAAKPQAAAKCEVAGKGPVSA